MCGINGFNFKDENLLKKMSAITYSRGPDNEGFFLSDEYSVSHNRLSIIDPEERSNQPFIYKNLILSFNGEIYNYMDLKDQMIQKGYKFKTNSDTELVVKLYFEYGVDSFKLLSGIFAISIFDKIKKKIILIRDIVGVKPLYYYFNIQEKKFIFSSLIKPILLSLKNKKLNHNSLISYSNFNRNDYSETYFKDIFKVNPGELIIFQQNNILKKKFLNFEFQNEKKNNIAQDIENIFSKQFVSDVPIALSLSGGVDSNLIFSTLLKSKKSKFNVYSVYFEGSEKYSADFKAAKTICKHNNTNINPVAIKPKDFIDYSEKVVDIVEEPVGNTNSIANYILSKNVSEKVLFSGDGGDEIFSGYDRYKSIHLINLCNFLNPLKHLGLNFKNKNLKRFFINNSREMFLSFSEQNLFKSQSKVYKNFQFIDDKQFNKNLNHSSDLDPKTKLSYIMYHDLDTWIQNDVLLRNDKIYANSSIELRVPFLDQKIIENYLMINDYEKFGFFLKYKNLIIKNFKEELKLSINQKLGFNTPFASYLRTELFDFAKNILSKEYYNSSSLIDFNECSNLLNKHKHKYFDPYLIWNLVSLQIFLRKFRF
tara:strand:- start:153 stop:1934 length:1782 start_codon:yes stop_codon:yes gene_type:complete